MPGKKLNLGILAHVVTGKATPANRLRRARRRRRGRFCGQRAAAAERVLSRGPRGWLTPGAIGLGAAVVASGAAMAALGLFVAARFTEDNFTPARGHLWQASLSIFRRGVTLARYRGTDHLSRDHRRHRRDSLPGPR
jgi:hypothetical protein